MTPEERAAAVYGNATGPLSVRRYACDALESEIAEAIRAAVADERERCARMAEVFADRINPDNCSVAGASAAIACRRLADRIRKGETSS